MVPKGSAFLARCTWLDDVSVLKQEILEAYASVTGFSGSGTGVSPGKVETVSVPSVEMFALVLREARHLLKVTQPLNWEPGLESSRKLSPHSDFSPVHQN